MNMDISASRPPSGKTHRQQREVLTEKERQRQDLSRRNKIKNKTPPAYRGHTRATSAGISRSVSMRSSPQSGRKSSDMAFLENGGGSFETNGRGTPSTPRKITYLGENNQPVFVSRSTDSSPVSFNRNGSKGDLFTRSSTTPSPKLDEPKSRNSKSPVDGGDKTRKTNGSSRKASRGNSKGTSPDNRSSSQNGTAPYAYIGPNSVTVHRERPGAAKLKRTSPISSPMNGRKSTEGYTYVDNDKHTRVPQNSPVGVRRTGSLKEHLERSRICSSTENSPALARKHTDASPQTPNLKLTNGNWCSNRGLPSALLTDMHLFRKLYMVQLEKEARKEVEEHYLKYGPPSRVPHDSYSAIPTGGGTPRGRPDETATVLASPRSSILKQTMASDPKMIVKSQAPSAKKRVSFSAECSIELKT